MKGNAGSRSEDPFASFLAVLVAGLLLIPALIWLGRGESAGELAPPAGMFEVVLRTVLVAGGAPSERGSSVAASGSCSRPIALRFLSSVTRSSSPPSCSRASW